ncbi:hypothetical protein [Hydrogenophaga intermedia]|jgi:pimeloyl-ACP methyl ester carboxylesterase|uniref:hypothetical protein n=1 Tax=Hydrogenophaga intermedia TaxID=65786 RepID=UPI00204475B8|nr:hypothetical protein [Hydrogenophaga intermedia]MCM3563789.1 hypothetical protein [Hydrogenophaga intermedia]
MRHPALLLSLLIASAAQAQGCGEVLSIATAASGELRAAYVAPTAQPPVTLLLLPGGGGHADLDAQGCAQQLKGNSLNRSLPLFQAQGLGTVFVDAPRSHQGPDGLGGHRVLAAHADELGRVIAAVRARGGGAVWVVGTSRGAISAVNAAARLKGDAAPDGVVLTSAVVLGDPRARKPWVAHSVFDLPLADIAQPLLVVVHAQDNCLRSPPTESARVIAATRSVRAQAVSVTGGPGVRTADPLQACEGRSPHGFAEQEADVAQGIARFVRGARY